MIVTHDQKIGDGIDRMPSTLTTYVVICDRCGKQHDHPDIMPDESVKNAAFSGWHLPSLFPGDDFHKHPVYCPNCRQYAP